MKKYDDTSSIYEDTEIKKKITFFNDLLILDFIHEIQGRRLKKSENNGDKTFKY